MTSKSKFQQLLALSLTLFIASNTYVPAVFASVGAPCDQTASNASPNPSADPSASPTSDSNNQKNTYCAAAKNADDAASAQKTGTIIWGTVAGVCLTACALMEMDWATGDTLNNICTVTDIAGAGADLILSMATSKKFSDSLTSVAGAAAEGVALWKTGAAASLGKSMGIGGSSATTAGTNVAKPAAQVSTTAANSTAPTAGKAGTSTGSTTSSASKSQSCWSGGIAAAMAVIKGIQSSSSSKSRDDNLANAQQLSVSGGAVSGGLTTPLQLSQANSTSDGTAVGSGNATVTPTTANSTAGSATASNVSSCSSSQTSGNAQAFIACATANNPKLRDLVGNPAFLAGLEKASGMSAGDFFKSLPNSATPGEIMAASMGGVANPVGVKNKMADSLADLNNQALAALNSQNSGTHYASSGSAGPSLGAQTGSLFGSNSDSGVVASGESASFNRSPATLGVVGSLDLKTDGDGILTNKNLSLFEVVTHQYQKSKAELENRPWAVPYNRFQSH